MATLIPRPFSFIKNQDWASDYVRAAIRDNRDGSLSNRALINASSALFDTVAGRQPTRPEFFARLSQFVMAHPSYAAPAGPLRVQTRAPQRAFLDLESIDLDTGGDDMAAPTLIVPGGLTRLLPDGLMRVATRLPSGDVAVKPQPGMDLSAMEQQVDQINRMLRAQGASLQQLLRWSGPADVVALGYDANRGIAASYQSTDPYHGGTIVSDTALIPDGAAANTLFNVLWTDAARARMGRTRLRRVWVNCNPVSNAGAFSSALYLGQVTIYLNDFPLPQLANIPADQIAPTVIGDTRAFETDQMIQPGDVLSAKLLLTGNVPNTTPLANSAFQVFGDFGREA